MYWPKHDENVIYPNKIWNVTLLEITDNIFLRLNEKKQITI